MRQSAAPVEEKDGQALSGPEPAIISVEAEDEPLRKELEELKQENADLNLKNNVLNKKIEKLT